MQDSEIVDLYWQRNEAAIDETESKYGKYCFAIANGILHDCEDAKECVNDTYLGAWNAIPPHRPVVLSTFLGKITRRLSLKKLRSKSAEKRGGGVYALSLDELEECIPAGSGLAERIDAAALTDVMNAFLGSLPVHERRVFLRRYWFFDSVAEIAARYGFGESKVKMILKRTRDKLRICLKKEDIEI